MKRSTMAFFSATAVLGALTGCAAQSSAPPTLIEECSAQAQFASDLTQLFRELGKFGPGVPQLVSDFQTRSESVASEVKAPELKTSLNELGRSLGEYGRAYQTEDGPGLESALKNLASTKSDFENLCEFPTS